MNTLRRALAAAALIGSGACSSTVDSSLLTSDAAPADSAADVTAVDQGTALDVGTPSDLGPTTDVGPTVEAGEDVPVPGDVGLPDAVPVDVPGDVPGDVATGASIEGRWRVVGWDYTPLSGETVSLIDRDRPIRDGMSGMTNPYRTNGIFVFRPTRMSWSFGTIGGGHFYAYRPTSMASDGYSASGNTLPGLLDGAAATFTVAGGTPVLSFARNPDGTITLDSEGGGERSRTTLARAPTSPVQNTLNLTGYAQIRDPARARPLLHPRFSLLWDAPGGSAPVETNNTALSFVMAYAQYFIVQAGAPAEALQGRAFGVPIALAYLFVYDDVNENGRYDVDSTGAGDESRGFGPLVIAWRGEGTPNAAFGTSPLVDLQPGWQIAHLHADVSSGGFTVVPFDTTVPVTPDTPVLEAPLRGAVPRFVR